MTNARVCQYILLLVLVKQEDMMTHALRESFCATAGRSNNSHIQETQQRHAHGPTAACPRSHLQRRQPVERRRRRRRGAERVDRALPLEGVGGGARGERPRRLRRVQRAARIMETQQHEGYAFFVLFVRKMKRSMHFKRVDKLGKLHNCSMRFTKSNQGVTFQRGGQKVDLGFDASRLHPYIP